MKTEYTYENEDGEEVVVELPTRFEVCDDCEGHGSVMNESMRQHAYSREEFEDTFHDPEDRAEYFKRGGIYDVQCPTCKGARVVPVVNEDHLTAEERGHWKRICELEADRRQYERECADERRNGC